jgi:hypothetical protein
MIKNSKYLLFADDVKILRDINFFDDGFLLHSDIDRLKVRCTASL